MQKKKRHNVPEENNDIIIYALSWKIIGEAVFRICQYYSNKKKIFSISPSGTSGFINFWGSVYIMQS